MLRPLFATAAAAAALAASAAAQPAVQATLIGFRSGVAPSIDDQILCNPVQRVCPTGMASAAAPYAGGAAYNAINGSLWHTQGTRMSEVRIGDCALLCSVPAQLTLGPGSLATGLSIVESRFEMYQTESLGGAIALHVWHLRSCPPQVIRSCRLTLASVTQTCGAVAVDDKNGVIYYATSNFNPASAANNTVLVAKLTDPCNPFCRFTVDGCGAQRLGPITAMTYDGCTDQLYASDGVQVVTLRVIDPSNCLVREVACCNQPVVSLQRWHGFDVEPAHPRSVGRSCTGPGCLSCPSMALNAQGDPTVGNGAFQVAIDNAQGGANAFLLANAGPCQVPGFPFACGQVHVGLPIAVIPLGPIPPGMAICDGTIGLGLAIPNDYSLCGARLCLQGALVCPNPAGAGIALTNALDLTIGS